MGETILNLQPKPDPFEEEDGTSSNSAKSTQSQMSATENESGKPVKSREPEKVFMMSLFLSGLRRLYKQPERNKERPWTTDKDPSAEDPSQDLENEGPANDLDKLFENFLDSLAQICSFNDKSYMVTAVLVQQTRAGPVFHVTRDGIDHKGNGKDGDNLERFPSVVLNLIRGIREQTAEKFLDARRKPFACLLEKIVDGNQGHLKYYADRLRSFVGQYLDDMDTKKSRFTSIKGFYKLR